MKKFLFLILLLFFLVGCQPQELKVDTTETAKTPITTQTREYSRRKRRCTSFICVKCKTERANYHG